MEALVDMLEEYDSSEKRRNDKAFTTQLMRELRKSKLRRTDIVLNCGPKCYKSEKGNEAWSLLEQICIASFDCGEVDLANVCIKRLLRKFPTSIRVNRLVGMLKEVEGNYTAALEIYANLLAKNPGNLMILKRKACVHKAMGNQGLQVEELNNIAKIYPGDASTWLELSDLYLSMCNNEAAAYCLEELILLEPLNAHYHTRLAEIYYSLGGIENFVNARRHYASSLNNQSAKFNFRALYGLLAVCQAIVEETSGGGVGAGAGGSSSSAAKKGTVATAGVTQSKQEVLVNTEMLRWAKQQLEEIVDNTANNEVMKLVLDVVK